MARWGLVAVLAVALWRCDCGGAIVDLDAGSGLEADAGRADAAASDVSSRDGAVAEAAVGDATTGDAGENDASTREAGPTDATATDASTSPDILGPDTAFPDSAAPDAAIADSALPDTSPSDAGLPDASVCSDSCVPGAPLCHRCVDITIDNFCNVSIDPAEITVESDVTLMLTFNNRSVDYAADVWSSSGYGYIELPTGWSWEDPIWHCAGPTDYTEYFDISIYGGPSGSCPGERLLIHCN